MGVLLLLVIILMVIIIVVINDSSYPTKDTVFERYSSSVTTARWG